MILTLSKSEIGVLRRCPRRYYYEYELGRTPAQGPGVEAEWGTALHRGLEAWFDDMRRGKGLPPRLHWAIDSALASGINHDGRPYAPPADPYARAALRAMLRAYAEVWGPSDATKYEAVAVELPFDLPVLTKTGRESRNGAGAGARREGRIDAVVRERIALKLGETAPDERCGAVWIVEHKSTGKPPAEERFYHGLELDLQTALYSDAARELGHNPAGVLYDVVRRPDFDEPKPAPALTKKGEPRKVPTVECYACNGLGRTWSEDNPLAFAPCEPCKGEGRIAKPVHYSNPRFGEPAAAYEERVYKLATESPADWFARRELPIADWQIEEARADVHAAAQEVAWRRRTGHWPRVGDRYVCAAPRMVCPWLDVCGHRQSAEDDRLFPLKVRREENEER